MSSYQQKTLAQLQDSKVTATLQSPPSQVASSKAVQRPALGKVVAGEQMLQEAVLDSAEQDGSAGSGQALEDEASAALPAQGFDAASEFESNASLPVPGQGGGVDHASLSPSLQPSLQEPPWIQREKDERKGLAPLLGGNSSATTTPASPAQAPKEDASSMDTLRLLGGVLVAAGASGGAGSLLSDTQADVTPPTLVISSSAASVKAGQSAIITFTFSEVPKLFTAEDITTTNGVLSGMTVSADPKVYRATFKPLDNPTAPSASITVANASYVDGAGNTGAGATTNINVDTVAPLAPTINAVATNDIINAAEVASVISGNNEAGSSVTLSIGGNARAAVVNGASWSYALQASDISAMGEGPETLSVVQTDSAGNQSGAGKRDITVDTQAPVAPTIKGFEIGSKITGTNEAGASVALSIGENTPRAATVVGTSWSFTLIASDLALLGQGAATLSAVQTDAAGNKSPIGTAAISVDTEAPIAPVINVVATDDVINALEIGSTTITGLNEVGATVALSIGGNMRAATVSGTSWSYALVPADITAMGQGAETLSVTQTDASGNTSAASTRAIMVDTAAPLALSINVVASDNIINAAEVASTITGSNEAGAKVALSIGGNTRAAAVSGTTWSYALQADDITAMGQGTEILSATQTDASGNKSEAGTRSITVDTLVPAAPAINVVATDDIVNAAEVTSTLTGTNEAGATVALSIGGNTRAATVSGTTWSYALQSSDITAMGQGTEILSATQTDAAGNKSAAGTRTITVDSLAKGAPVIGLVASDDIINASEVANSITGTNVAGSTVALSIGGNTRAATVSGTSWSYALQSSDITAMGQGTEILSATQTDTSGNQSAAGTRTITVDTLVPVAPVINLVAGDDIVNAAESASTLSGTNEAGARSVALSIGSGNVRQAIISGSTWSYALISSDIDAMGQGTEILSAIQTDAAGNTSPAGTRSISVDTIVKGAPVINAVASDDKINASEVASAITGTNVAGSTVALNIGGNTRAATVSGTSWSYALQASDITAMGQGAETLSATQTDTAGNQSAAGTRNITVDTLMPTAPVISLVATDDIINASETSSTLSGTNEAGATVALSIGGNSRAATVSGTSWSYALQASDITAMGQGAETLSATQTDALGNQSAAGTRAITVDTAAPTLAITSNTSTLKAGQTAAITFTFTEDPGNTFTSADVVLSGGTLGAISGNDLTRTATFTPTADLPSGNASITVASGTYTDAAGNPGGAGTLTDSGGNSISIDTLAPTQTVSSVDISTDSGLNTDFITNTAAQTITATLSAALATGDTLFGSTNNGSSWTAITSKVSDKTISWDGAALSGSSNIVFKLTDAAGNTGANTGSQAYVLDVTAPTLSTTIYSAPENGTSVATLAGSDVNTITYSLSGAGADNSKFSLSSGGVLTLNTSKNFEAPGSAAGTNAYSLTINMLDAAGNSGNQAVTVNVTDVLENNAAGQSVIDLGIYGYLIDPVQVDGNNWYYYWDRSGDGTSANTGPLNGGVDYTESAVIYPLFTKDIWLSATTAATSDVYRYALMNGVKVALPTVGVPPSVYDLTTRTDTFYPPGTAVGATNPGDGSTLTNNIYNDLFAIWDAYNGTGTLSGVNGYPVPWVSADYFSSTPVPGIADYFDVYFPYGDIGQHAGSGGAATYVALQVLQVTSLAVTNTSGSYTSSTNTLVLTGSNYSSLLQTGETASTDIKARLDWSKLSWDIDGNTTGTTDIGFALSDISSAKVTDSTHLTIVLSNAKATSLEAASGYAGSTLDKLDITTGFARDAVGNVATTDGVVNAPLSVPSAGDAVIDLGSYGKLFLPVQVEGTWYYHWDRSGDGNSWDSADKFTHDELDLIFKYDINGNEGTGGTTDTYRYATLNGIKVALPTINMSGEFAKYFTGTAYVDNQIPSNNTSSPLYDEWLAIWDAWNGSGVENGANVNTTDFGSPKMNITQYDGRTWQTQYWTATAYPANALQHYKFQLNGLGIALGDTESAWVALKVL